MLTQLEACFVAAWHSKHSRQCPNAEAIKKDFRVAFLVRPVVLVTFLKLAMKILCN